MPSLALRITPAGPHHADVHLLLANGAAASELAAFLALDLDPADGSAVAPFSAGNEGSTVFLPFLGDVIHRYTASGATSRRWSGARWEDAAPAHAPEAARRSGDSIVFRVARPPGDAPLRLVAWVKDLSVHGGWGRLVATTDPAIRPGPGDVVLGRFVEARLEGEGEAARLQERSRSGFAEGRAHLYQLLVRTFSNTNETRQPNGSLATNGSGRFADLNDAALAGLRELGATHVWLTGVPRQATATDWSSVGLPPDDADLLKGLAGSPYAIRDYFDVSPDYAVDPARRRDEFRAAVARARATGLRVLIDFVPNHVARSHASTVRPDLDFGRRGRGGAGDDPSRFFDPQNNFFYLQPGVRARGEGPPLRLPSFDPLRREPLSPTARILSDRVDGLFDGEREFVRVTGNNAATWAPSIHDWYETVKLNYGYDFTSGERAYPNAHQRHPIPDTWHKMDAVLAHWQELGVDGFRCDMAHMVPPEFWRWAIGRARARQSDVVFIAEAYATDPARVPGTDPVTSAMGGPAQVLIDLLAAGFDAVYDDAAYDRLKDVYDGHGWANDLDALLEQPFLFAHSLRYAENHDEVRLAAAGQWGGVGMEVGRAVTPLLLALGPGPTLLYAGQEVGEPAAGAEGFGGDDGRTSIFDYWSMPELAKWVNGHAYDGGRLSEAQRSLRAFHARLGRLLQEPALRSGATFPLNRHNVDNPAYGRLPGETASGHWLYSFLRRDRVAGQSLLVVVNLHPAETLRAVRIRLPIEALDFLERVPARAVLRERLHGEGALSVLAAPHETVPGGLLATLPDLPPLTAWFLEW